MGFHSSPISKIVLSICVLLLIYLIYAAKVNDTQKSYNLRYNVDIWDTPMNKYDQIIITKLIDDYHIRKRLNKSNYKRMLISARAGMVRGAVAGVVMNGPSGIIPGMILWGLLSALDSGIHTQINPNRAIY